MAFDPRKLTVKAGEAIQRAQELVEQRQHRFVRPLHLLKSLEFLYPGRIKWF